MSRKTGRSKRIRLFERGNVACPICLTDFARDDVSSGRTVTLEHVPIKALGGQARCLTCGRCNAQAGRGIDQVAAMGARDRVGVTVDILGKRRTFTLSPDGKALTLPLAGFSKQDIRDLENSESRRFTMSIQIPDAGAIAASSLKSAYLALFSLLGPPGGYSYARSDAVEPIRRLILEPLEGGAIGEYVTEAPDDVALKDIMLTREPLECWIVNVAGHLVVLPLSGESPTSQPLRDLRELGGGEPFEITGLASWSFSTFGTFRIVSVQLAGADTGESLVGLRIAGTLPNGIHLEGTCISHSGESATLLCPGPATSRARIALAS